jgi:hypothetical protein
MQETDGGTSRCKLSSHTLIHKETHIVQSEDDEMKPNSGKPDVENDNTQFQAQ